MKLPLAVLLLGLVWRCQAQDAAVFMSPGIEAIIVNRIESETEAIRVEAYSFTSKAIAEALAAAQSRKVDVKVILDAKWQQNRSAQPVIAILMAAKIPVFLDAKHPIAHAKVMIFKALGIGELGSYNYTAQAEHLNHEVAAFITVPSVVQSLWIDWENHLKHSTPMSKATEEPKK